MQHLIVISHPRQRSFTQAVARAYVEALEAQGHRATLRDLYALRFDPVLAADELMGPAQVAVPAAVREEQRHVLEAEAIAFFYPIWWGYMPAMLKGYFDRVFSLSFAYEMHGEAMTPRLSGKRAVIVTSSGADLDYLRDSGQWEAMRRLEHNQLLAPCGIELLEHVHFPSITPDLPEQVVRQHLARARELAAKHWARIPA
jgi:NAD(P)H dehydrogenase (quinone)